MRLNHLLTERLVGKHAKLAEITLLVSPHRNKAELHDYRVANTDTPIIFFPHWQWLSARDGLRFGP